MANRSGSEPCPDRLFTSCSDPIHRPGQLRVDQRPPVAIQPSGSEQIGIGPFNSLILGKDCRELLVGRSDFRYGTICIKLSCQRVSRFTSMGFEESRVAEGGPFVLGYRVRCWEYEIRHNVCRPDSLAVLPVAGACEAPDTGYGRPKLLAGRVDSDSADFRTSNTMGRTSGPDAPAEALLRSLHASGRW
jgi:hypothetical protein